MQIKTINPEGERRVVVNFELPGEFWKSVLTQADCHVDILQTENAATNDEIKQAVGDNCQGIIGQLTEDWNADLLKTVKEAGVRVYSNFAVGYNNVDVTSATKLGVAIGNTPGVLTETTAELTVALTLATARHIPEADAYMRADKFTAWLPNLFLGRRLRRKTIGVVGAGRIGAAYARMMVEGFKMNLIYYDPSPKKALEDAIKAYGDFLTSMGEGPVTVTRAQNVDEVLKTADLVSVHTPLNESTTHLISADRLSLMREDAILINTSRGPVIDETALVAHLKANPNFRAGLDVFEDEPKLKPGLIELKNAVLLPHIGSATKWTREGMSTLAARNVAGILSGYPIWQDEDVLPFLSEGAPKATPSIVNAHDLGL